MLECVVNLSEGRNRAVVDRAAGSAEAAGCRVLDVHVDAWHHRCVLTLADPCLERGVRAVAEQAVASIDLSAHRGAHPRLGALDVVPFVPLGTSTLEDAISARDSFARWAAGTLGIPCFVYGPERTLPELRRQAFSTLAPVAGPSRPHPTAGATAVGARGPLVAYNLWLDDTDLAEARAIASALRSPAVMALAFDLGGRTQLSFNLVDPARVGPDVVFDVVAQRRPISKPELVGLIPEAALLRIPPKRWPELGLEGSQTIEARIDLAGKSRPARP